MAFPATRLRLRAAVARRLVRRRTALARLVLSAVRTAAPARAAAVPLEAATAVEAVAAAR